MQWRALRIAPLAIVLVIVGSIAVGAFTSVAKPHCAYKQRDMVCNSCGITRSVTAVLHGDLRLAREMHPAGLPMIILIGILLLTRPVPFIFPNPQMILADFLAIIGSWAWICIHFFGNPFSGFLT